MGFEIKPHFIKHFIKSNNIYYDRRAMSMKKVYPIFISQDKEDFLVYVPDMDIYTEGKDMADAIEMARDAIGLQGIAIEDTNGIIPEASDYEAAVEKAKANTDIYDYTKGILTMVDIDFSEYRRKVDNKAVRRNVTLPNWLNVEAEKAQLNVSKLLQEALMAKLNINKY